MKQLAKVLSFALAATLIVSLAACNKQPKAPSMYIDKAQLTKQENGIATLLGASSGQLVYDFVLDEKVKSMQIRIYKLENGSWDAYADLSSACSGQNGRLAFGFDLLANGFRVAVQDESEIGSSTYTPTTKADFSGMAHATSRLDQRTPISYEQEIPLVIQVSTTKNEIASYDVDAYFTPVKYAERGYEHVYAATILFSSEAVDDSSSPDEHPVEASSFIDEGEAT